LYLQIDVRREVTKFSKGPLIEKKHKQIELALVVCAGIGPCMDYE
jgi:hypothetical protein